MEKGFWQKLERPIIALSPMDGVTDAAFRKMAAKYGQPHVTITEFTSVEGICHGAVKQLVAFLYDESERPIVAQVYGSTPESFYKTAFVCAELGFDGIDINMGCPAKSVAAGGAGAGLILTPAIAKKIVGEVKRGLQDWANGMEIEKSGLPESIIEYVIANRPADGAKRRLLPVSIKTRIGYDKITIEEWVKHLLETEPANISIHGRTLKQLYSGSADWEAIAKAATIIHQTQTTVLGNGDIKNIGEALQKIEQYKVDGVLIGRAAFGNPWLFNNKEATVKEKLQTAVEHSNYYERIFGNRMFVPMRKHLSWYCRGFVNASDVRQKLMQAESPQDVEKILQNEKIME
jgi:nifR3 family TIM-barrel protein